MRVEKQVFVISRLHFRISIWKKLKKTCGLFSYFNLGERTFRLRVFHVLKAPAVIFAINSKSRKHPYNFTYSICDYFLMWH